MGKRVPKSPVRSLYHHTPMVTDKFDATDLYSSQIPLPGIDFHNNERLHDAMVKRGVAPDWMFQQGIAAPPLGRNESGLRNYTVEFNGDPRLVINLDLPLHQQTPEVQAALEKVGVFEDVEVNGRYGQPVAELLWQKGLLDAGQIPSRLEFSHSDTRVREANNKLRQAQADIAQSIIAGNPNFEDMKNAAAPAILDSLRTAGIPAASRQGLGKQAGSVYLPMRMPTNGAELNDLSPYDQAMAIRKMRAALQKNADLFAGTKDYKVFDPNAVRITRTLAVPGAVAAGAAASGVQAGENESLPEYFQRMQPKQAGETPAAPPERSWSQFAKDVGSAAYSMVPSKQDITGSLPYYAQEFLGTAQPLSSFSSDFPEMADYEARVRAAFESDRVIRDGSELLTPAEYIERQVSGGDPDKKELAQLAKQAVLHSFLGGGTNDYSRAVLDKLRAQGVGGREQVFPGQTLVQREAKENARPENPGYGDVYTNRYTTSEGMDQNLLSDRAYDLFSALQDDPKYAPLWSDPASGALSAVGGVAGMAAPHTLAGQQAMSLGQLRNLESADNPRRARVKEALYWHDLASEGQLQGAYRDAQFGGFSPKTSNMVSEGLNRQMNEDNANVNTFYSNLVIPQLLAGTPTVSMDDTGPTLRSFAHRAMREVPIVNPGEDPAELAQKMQEAEQYFGAQDRDYINSYPLMQRDWNSVMEGDGLGTQGYSYPSAANNMVATLPRYYFDLPTIATLGAGGAMGVLGGLKSGMKASTVARGMGKTFAKDFAVDAATQELPFTAAVHMAAEPYRSNPSSMFEPLEFSDVQDDEGNVADPNDPRYPEYYKKLQDRQKKLLGGLLRYEGEQMDPGPSRGNQSVLGGGPVTRY